MGYAAGSVCPTPSPDTHDSHRRACGTGGISPQGQGGRVDNCRRRRLNIHAALNLLTFFVQSLLPLCLLSTQPLPIHSALQTLIPRPKQTPKQTNPIARKHITMEFSASRFLLGGGGCVPPKETVALEEVTTAVPLRRSKGSRSPRPYHPSLHVWRVLLLTLISFLSLSLSLSLYHHRAITITPVRR